MSDQTKAIVRRIVDEVWGKGQLAVVDELFSPDFVDHDFRAALGPGTQGFKNTVMMFRNGMPDLATEIDMMLDNGEFVATRLRFKGTQDGMIMGFPPSNKLAEVSQLSIFRVVHGRIVELWHNADTLGMLHQLGALPPPGPPPGQAPVGRG